MLSEEAWEPSQIFFFLETKPTNNMLFESYPLPHYHHQLTVTVTYSVKRTRLCCYAFLLAKLFITTAVLSRSQNSGHFLDQRHMHKHVPIRKRHVQYMVAV